MRQKPTVPFKMDGMFETFCKISDRFDWNGGFLFGGTVAQADDENLIRLMK